MIGGDVMDVIVADHRARRDTQRVDAPHVRQHAANIVDVIELDPIVLTDTASVAPDPTGGDPGVTAVLDLVMRDHIAFGMHQQDAHGGGIIDSVVMQPVVANRVVVRPLPRRILLRSPVDAKAAGGDLADLVADELVAGASGLDVECERAEIR